MQGRERLIELLKMVEYQYTIMCSIFTENVADWLLQHGVIVPPCKAGDTVYILRDGKILSAYVTEIFQEMDSPKWFVRTQLVKDCWDMQIFLFCDFGKTVFLTHEEAELKKMGGDGE